VELGVAFVERHTEVIPLIFKRKPICTHHLISLRLKYPHQRGFIQAYLFILCEFPSHLLHFPFNRPNRLLWQSVLSQIKICIPSIHLLVWIT